MHSLRDRLQISCNLSPTVRDTTAVHCQCVGYNSFSLDVMTTGAVGVVLTQHVLYTSLLFVELPTAGILCSKRNRSGAIVTVFSSFFHALSFLVFLKVCTVLANTPLFIDCCTESLNNIFFHTRYEVR